MHERRCSHPPATAAASSQLLPQLLSSWMWPDTTSADDDDDDPDVVVVDALLLSLCGVAAHESRYTLTAGRGDVTALVRKPCDVHTSRGEAVRCSTVVVPCGGWERR